MSRRRRARRGRAVAVAALGLAATILTAARPQAPASLVPGLRVDRLDNGLTVVTLPLPDPDRVVFATIVRGGVRSESEPGSEGFSHLLGHLAARGPRLSPRGFDPDLTARLGSSSPSIPADDATIRTVAFSGRENLEDVVRGEAERFVHLGIDAEAVRFEAAVLAVEAGARAADPEAGLEDALRRTAFPAHPYGRPASGRPGDFASLPERAAAAQLYKQRAFASDNAVLLAAGDIAPARFLELVKRYYGAWEKSSYEMAPPPEPRSEGARRERVAWPAPTAARLALGFRGPAFSDREPDKAALDLLAAAAFSPASPLYDRLVRRDRVCRTLEAAVADRRDPYLFEVRASAAAEADLPAIEKAVRAEIERLRGDLLPAQSLAAAKSGLRAALAAQMETTEGKASVLSRLIALTGDPASLDRWVEMRDRIDAFQVREAARRYLGAPEAAVVLAAGPGPAPETPAEAADKAKAETPDAKKEGIR